MGFEANYKSKNKKLAIGVSTPLTSTPFETCGESYFKEGVMSIDWSKPLRTVKDHLPCRVLCIDRKLANLPIIVLANYQGVELEYCLFLDGRRDENDSTPFVENISEEKYVWINVYKHPSGSLIAGIPRDGKEDLPKKPQRFESIVGRIKIKLEEGRWDE